MERTGTFRELVAWQVSMDMVVLLCRWASTLPSDERFALRSQLQRAATAVPLNIAEGWGWGSTGNFLRHCRQARASLAELETAIEIVHRVYGLDAPEELLEKRAQCGRVLQGLIASLERRVTAAQQPPP